MLLHDIGLNRNREKCPNTVQLSFANKKMNETSSVRFFIFFFLCVAITQYITVKTNTRGFFFFNLVSLMETKLMIMEIAAVVFSTDPQYLR